jgi:SAM-dependent methyltransferase
MFGLLKKNRMRLTEELSDHDQRKYFSPAYYSQDKLVVQAISRYARGKLIDIGCGNMPFGQLIENLVEQYDTIDVDKRDARLKYQGDVQAMPVLNDQSYDSAICFSVLEHIPQPARALAEINRILKPQGVLLLTVPLIARLHEEPHDYFRFTRHGMRFLLENAGFSVIDMQPLAGIFSFLGHQVSTAFLCSLWHIPVVKKVALGVNFFMCVEPCSRIDKIFGLKELMPLGYLCVAKKN